MSDLEQHIANWRAELAQSQALASSDLDEIESHLREEIGHLQTTGLSETEAFLVARHRLGDTPVLAAEFRKVNADWQVPDRMSWMALGACVYLLGAYVVSGISQGGVVAAAQLGMRGYSLGVLRLALEVAAIATCLALVWVVYRQRVQTKPETTWPVLSRRALGFLCAALVVADLTLIAAQLLFRLAAVQTLGATEFGRMTIVSAYTGLIWTFLAPILAGALVMVLRARALRRREVCCAGPSE